MTFDPRQVSNPATANHHWHPFLRYQQQCKSLGKEPSINEWLRSSGKLNDLIDFEKAKAAATEFSNDKK